MKTKTRGPHGLMFHYFHDGLKHKPSQGSVSKEQFENMLKKVGMENILPAKGWASKAEKGTLKKNDICITFDDGLSCQYDVALPILQKYNLTAFWFVNSSTLIGEIGNLEAYRKFRNEYFPSMNAFYDNFFSTALESTYKDDVNKGLSEYPKEYLSEFTFYTEGDRKFRYLRDKVLGPEGYDEIMNELMRSKGVKIEELAKGLWLEKNHLRSLKDEGHIIGIHSHSHPTSIAELSFQEQQKEYKTNFEILSEILGEKPVTMAHPCNSYSDETLKILKNMGIKIGFCSNMTKTEYSILELPREDSACLG